MENQKDWYNDRVTDLLSASNYVQKMSLEKTEKKLLLSLIQSDINKAVKAALERAEKSD
tara:strand:+ start:2449 stop:2625 length:177 start_codon:yes stop_codon:yes gene_type:complete